ncbi:hypothetical protein [Parafrankia sp. BMG5.11]|uniref:hypothetical protein n=1 Tax=Parafrankia sp. BMG5.11 TaxID=222540 RepID=UPI00103F3393|nr:hypothetical protein [Parafrankia sp. BMG5.11]TCJ36568.1 hypothetical protein E0504_22805 [Parafrankia sp. BMG5.11]
MRVARVLRKRWRSASALLGAVAALAAVGAVAVVAAFDSQHTVTSGPPPAAASPLQDSPDPDGQMLLPPARTFADNGVPLHFPHTTAGAVSAAVRWSQMVMPRDPADQTGIFAVIATRGYLTRAEGIVDDGYSPPHLPPDGALFFRPLGARILSAEADRTTVALLHTSRVATSATPTPPLIGTVTWTLTWTDGDWRLDDIHPTPPSARLRLPISDSPAAVTAAGWDRFHRA